MSISQHIPEGIKRSCRAIGCAAWLDDVDSWMGLPVVLMARLTVRQRAALAHAALKSPDHELACRTAEAVLSTPIKQGEAA